MKDYSHIEALLERYYDAQTSEAEEQRLKDFFLHEEVPAHLQAEKEMFLQLQATDVPEGLEERLSQSIDRWGKKHRTLRLQWIGSIAASLLLLFGAGWYLQEPPRKDTCATPEEAYMEAQKALVLFSTALNKGMKQMDVLQETTERVEKIFTYNEPN
ncbi:MAG: hypothetical protein IJA95_01870 [Bacteroidaceae bacterium]|nr:hypothetical protein [Bacteroidaceae bacterium]